jgi:hypothetical protein
MCLAESRAGLHTSERQPILCPYAPLELSNVQEITGDSWELPSMLLRLDGLRSWTPDLKR